MQLLNIITRENGNYYLICNLHSFPVAAFATYKKKLYVLFVVVQSENLNWN